MQFEKSGQLTPSDNRSYVVLPVDVPLGITQFHVQFEFTPERTAGQPYPQQISLFVADPAGPRAEGSHIHPEGITINAGYASPGALAGPIQPGRWNVFVIVHRIMPPTPVEYHLAVTLSSEPTATEPHVFTKAAVAPRGAGWYRGDLHAHTIHSDGSWTIAELMAFWRARQLDFMTLSDHNTIAGNAEAQSLASDDLMVIRGTELSTFRGHCLALGVDRWYEWRTDPNGEMSITDLARQVLDGGAFLVIAHPMAPGDPECCGCHWEHLEMMPGFAPAVEIWNGYWADYNEQGLQLFYQWLNDGNHLVATSGTDIHGPPTEDGRGAANVVYAEALSEEAILAALRKGHSYISAGPQLLLNGVSAAGQQAMMGDTLPDEGAEITASWDGAHEGDSVRFVVNGRIHETQPAAQTGQAVWPLKAGEAAWCTVELRDHDGGLWAVTNPIFMNAG